MKNHELLDLIGEVNRDYVLAADRNVIQPRYRWKILAACAACAALALGAYPVWRMTHTARTSEENAAAALHDYAVVEGGGGVLTEQAEIKTAFSGTGGGDIAPIPEATGPADTGRSGASYAAPGGDVPVEEDPCKQYNNLFENARLDQYPEWYGGAYIDYTTQGGPSKLVVCIVDGFHTPDLEQQIAGWCGEGVWTYRDVKYSRGYLQQLMEQLNGSRFLPILEADKAVSGWCVCEEDNCVQMDCSDVPNEATLAALSELDPEGDAVRVRVLATRTASTGIAKGPVPADAREDQPAAEPSLPPDEGSKPAQYDTPPAG